jgi:hypothetical protein
MTIEPNRAGQPRLDSEQGLLIVVLVMVLLGAVAVLLVAS